MYVEILDCESIWIFDKNWVLTNQPRLELFQVKIVIELLLKGFFHKPVCDASRNYPSFLLLGTYTQNPS